MHGGRSSNGIYCGSFYVNANDTAGYAYWDYGAVLSLLHIMFVVAVILVMVTDVGYLMYYVFLRMELFGQLVLLYHLN